MAPIVKPVSYSQTWTFFEGDWHEGNVPIMGPRTHAAWLASTVFDGARAFEGVAPDLDRHCARVNQSAINFKLKPVVDTATWLELAREGIARFDAKAELYIRPMYWAQSGSGGGVLFDPETTNWCLCIYVAPMPPPSGSAITLSPFRRPTMESAPVDCKAACLYPNNSRALIEAQARGFNNCLMLDMLGNVAEFGNSNVFMAKDGVVYTPAPNGTFLNGITRQRVIGLLRGDGVTVVETTLSYADFLGADEIFSSGNFAKVAPVIRIDDRSPAAGAVLRPGAETILGLRPRLNGLTSRRRAPCKTSRAVQHEFRIGQVGKTRPMRAFEIFAAARPGKNAGQGRAPVRSRRGSPKSCRGGSAPGRWRRRMRHSRRYRGNRSVASPAARSIRGGCAAATG